MTRFVKKIVVVVQVKIAMSDIMATGIAVNACWVDRANTMTSYNFTKAVQATEFVDTRLVCTL